MENPESKDVHERHDYINGPIRQAKESNRGRTEPEYGALIDAVQRLNHEFYALAQKAK